MVKVEHSTPLSGLGRDDNLMVRTLESISADDMLTLSIAQLTWRFDCSERTLNRFFHAHFGISARALRTEMRLQKGATLLRNPTATVIDVAKQCGYKQVGQFSAAFYRRFGMRPGQWRDTAATRSSATGAENPQKASWGKSPLGDILSPNVSLPREHETDDPRGR